MKALCRGAAIGFLCPMLFVFAIWMIQITAGVIAPGPEGPNIPRTVILMLWTLIFSSPLLLIGTLVGAVCGAVVGSLTRRPATDSEQQLDPKPD